MPGPEAKLERWCVDHARGHGAWLLKWQGPQRGLPDRILIKPGTREVLFVEFKSPTGRLSAMQRIWQDRIGTNVVRTKEEFIDLFEHGEPDENSK